MSIRSPRTGPRIVLDPEGRRWEHAQDGPLAACDCAGDDAPDGFAHALTIEPWRDRLGAYALCRGDVVELVRSHAPVRVPGEPDRVACVAVYLRKGHPLPARVNPVPELVFEVVGAPGRDCRRDYVDKREDYHRLGVREYVVINRVRRTVTVFVHPPYQDDDRVLTFVDTYRTPLLPGLQIDLPDVLGVGTASPPW